MNRESLRCRDEKKKCWIDSISVYEHFNYRRANRSIECNFRSGFAYFADTVVVIDARVLTPIFVSNENGVLPARLHAKS